MATVPEKKKSRLSKLFNRHHDQASSSGHAVHPPTSTGASGPIDSAYASSENDMSKRSQDMVPVASSDDRNLAMNQNTGEVVDEDTGEVVTVTTTTTTTTTTKTKGGKTTNVQVETAPGGGGSNPAMVEAPGDTPASGPRVIPHPAIAQPQPQRFPESTPHPSQPSYPSYTPQPAPSAQALPASQSPYPQQPSQHSMGSRISTVQHGAPYSDHSNESTSPHQTQAEQKSKPQFIPYDPRNPRKSPSQHQEDPAGPSTMAIPERNPNRAMSREENSLNDPVSPVGPETPTRQNFSYPARSNQNLRDDLPAGAINNVAPEGDMKPQSTFDSLKAAAVGLHGVGETLRGTLNAEIDSRYPRRNAEKAAAANAKNSSVLSRGEREMAGLRQNQGLEPTISGGNGEYQIPAQDFGDEWNGGVGAAAAAEEAGGATEQQRVGFGMRKLLKRRAVGTGKAQ